MVRGRRPSLPLPAPAVLAAALALAGGCVEPPAPEGEGRPAGRTTVVFKHFKVPGGSEPLDALVRRFEEENPDLRVVDEILPASTDQQHQFYVTALEAGSGDFDVFALDVIWVPEFRRAGWLRDVTGLLDGEEWRDFLPGPLLAVSHEGRRHAVPWYVDGGVLYTRTDLLEKHGLAPPATMEELREAARVVLERERDPALAGFVWQGRQYEGLVCVALEFITARGGAVLRDGRPALEEPEVIEALGFLRDLVREGISPPMVTSADEEATRHLFGSGKAVFLRNWPYAWSIFEREDSAVRGRVGVSALPPFRGGRAASTLGGWQLGINRFSPRPEAAGRLVRFLADPRTQRDFALSGGFKPARRSVYDDPRLLREQPFIARLRGIMEGTVPRPVTPFYPMISQILQAEFSAVVAGIRTPGDAMRSAGIQIGRILELEG